MVRAYGLLAVKGKAGETYNVGSSRSIAISELLREIITISGCEIRHETDPARMRPSDIPEIRADITKLQRDTGWTPEVPLAETLREMIEENMRKLSEGRMQ